MKLPSSWTTVTPLSKTLAMILFISLPFIGFYKGVWYGRQTSVAQPTIDTIIPDLNTNFRINLHRVTWDQITQEFNVWWDDQNQTLNLKNNLFDTVKQFTANDVTNITGKQDFVEVFKVYGLNVDDQSQIILIGLLYRFDLPEGGTTSLPIWVKFTVSDESLVALPINTTKVLLSKETLFYSDAEYNQPGSISGYNFSTNTIDLKFPNIQNNSQLLPVGLTADGQSLLINCFTASSPDFSQDYYFGTAKSCGDYLGNLTTKKLIKLN